MPARHPDSPGAGAVDGASTSGDRGGDRDLDGGQPAFGGVDPDTVAASALCEFTPTRCQARNRLYRNGVLELEGFPVADISDHLRDESAVIWLDLRDPSREDLDVLSAEF